MTIPVFSLTETGRLSDIAYKQGLERVLRALKATDEHFPSVVLHSAKLINGKSAAIFTTGFGHRVLGIPIHVPEEEIVPQMFSVMLRYDIRIRLEQSSSTLDPTVFKFHVGDNIDLITEVSILRKIRHSISMMETSEQSIESNYAATLAKLEVLAIAPANGGDIVFQSPGTFLIPTDANFSSTNIFHQMKEAL